MTSYLQKCRFAQAQITSPPSRELGISVVIPCFNENNLTGTLKSLGECELPDCDVEVIVVINAAAGCDAAISERNMLSMQEAEEWMRSNQSAHFQFYLLSFNNLPPRHAGVGLARKIGMDEAAGRFEEAGNPRGIILCLDADCTVEKNYLTRIREHFRENPLSPACSVYFEHPLSGDDDKEIYRGIIRYELFLRYYVEGLRFAGYPFAFHTIGSSMAVRSDVYQQQGGMNRRKAGEDFYFLHKIMPLGYFSEVNSTTVFPSARVSERVPFGTGRAMDEWMRDPGTYTTYSFQTFSEIKQLCLFLETLPADISRDQLMNGFAKLPAAVWKFLQQYDVQKKTEEILSNVSSVESFVNRFYRWFNGFMMLKYVHFSRDHFYPEVPVENAAAELLGTVTGTDVSEDPLKLLMEYRRRQREG